MEIERKYLVHEIPVDLTKYQVKHMEQMYVSVKPVIRIRRTDDRRVLTVKSKGLLSRQEFEMDLDEDEMARFLSNTYLDCPYYQPGDEYLVVRKQM